MNAQQAREHVARLFTQSFNKGQFLEFSRNLLNKFDESKAQAWNTTYVKDAFKPNVSRFERLGTYTSPDDEKVDLLVVHLTNESKLERARTANRNFVADHLKTRDEKDAALAAFVSPTEQQWRLSYVRMEYAAVETVTGKVGVETLLTPARRYSYIVGEGESCHTAQARFLPLLQDTENYPTLAQLEEAFSVEAVTKEFFNQYAALFGDIDAALKKLAAKDPALGKEFKVKNLSTVDFAKKLMGQVVFLYFLQKKGWLGVAKGQDWGTGPHDFLRQLARGTYGAYDNFFNDVLEPLFYETLATDRGHEAWCDRFKRRIPFLNGGLFEPLANYDWRKTDITLSNTLFTNTKRNEAGDIGTGILDVFDRYNFTVNEAEPLEKEVAIDPEMLGKVFENLIEENRRKGLGSYYTPREIVHYMCQESLINYLDTALNKDKETVPHKDIETFIYFGEQISHYEAVKARYAVKMAKSIEENARLIDEQLADITVCDPAVGSGAYPVGMMTEIVRARTALTPYFNDVRDRNVYQFKRHAIQNCLYGVDIDPGAVEIAKLRLWLSLVVDEEDVRQIKPLPNLDYKVVVGNSLLSVKKDLFNTEQFGLLEALKPKFFDESNQTKKAEYKRQIEKLIHELTHGREAFDFEIYFSEVFHANGGFDIVIANPPYLFARNSAEKGMTPEAKRYYYDNYKLAEYQVNLYPLFIEKADRLLASRGTLTFITPNNWLTINTNKTLRGFVLARSSIVIVNFYARVFESADVDSAILIYEKGQHNPHVRLLEYTDTFHELKSAPTSFFSSQRESVINVEMFKGSGAKADLITRIEGCSIPLKSIAEVKSGLMAYEVGKGTPPQSKEMTKRRVYHARVKRGAKWIEYLQGRDVCRYALNWSGEYLHYGDHLAAPRKDFRLFSTKRILVRQIPNKPPYCIHACYAENTILNDRNSLNIIGIKVNPLAVLAILNSRLTSFWFALKFGKLQRGLFPQFKANELADFPIPKKLSIFEARLAALATKATKARLKNPTADIVAIDNEIDLLVCSAFEVEPADLEAQQSPDK